MKKESEIKDIRYITLTVDVIMMYICLMLLIFPTEKIISVILCGVIVMLTIIVVALDIIIKDKKNFKAHCCLIPVWIVITILAFFN